MGPRRSSRIANPSPSFVFAAWIAPLVGPPIAVFVTAPFGYLGWFPFVFAIAAFFSYAGLLFFGLPLAIALRHFGRLSAAALLVPGSVVGGLMAVVLRVPVTRLTPWSDRAAQFSCGATVAGAIAIAFWRLSGASQRHRSDRSGSA